MSSTVNSTSSLIRLSGLSGSGIDTDAIVKQLMTAEKVPLNKLYQKKQLAEWKQDAYRDITNKLRELKDTFFNVTKSASNLMSGSSYKKFNAASTDNSHVTVSGNADSIAGTHTVSVISIAAPAQAVSAAGITDPLTGTAIADDAFNLSGRKINVTLSGVMKELSLGDYSAAPDTTGTKLQSLVDQAFGSNKIAVGYDKDTKKLTFDTINGAGKVTLTKGSVNDGLAALGFTSGASNRIDPGKSLSSLSSQFAKDLTFGADGKLKFTINGKAFTFDKSVTLSSMLASVNADTDAKVSLQYDETTDKMILTAKQTGAGDNLLIGTDQSGNFFGGTGAAGILTGSAATVQGKDASARIDGQLVTRSTNTFTLNGTAYTLIKPHTDPDHEQESVSLSANTDDVFNNIKGFVDKYNEVIALIHTKTGEKYNRDYQPLTDDQKESMSADEIKSWETKAKTGLLRNDPILQNITQNMRRALSDGVSGVTMRLSDIGITTGTYTENGKLSIDEAKLREAIAGNPDAISDLFAKKASLSYAESTTTALRSQRYAAEGLANRLSDILDDNIRTSGGKGLLLQTAGIDGDITEYTSTYYKQITDYTAEISDLTDRLNDREDAYYARFTAMEKYLTQMNAQSSWLSSQLSG